MELSVNQLGQIAQYLSQISWTQWAGIATAATTVWAGCDIIYNLYFHPLRHFPGPLLNRATTLTWAWSFVRGTLPFDVLAIHEKYGPVVRIRPGELTFIDGQAFRDIYGHRPHGAKPTIDPATGEPRAPAREMVKFPPFYKQFRRQGNSIVSADVEQHAMLRRLIAPSFSDKAMREQEPLITRYVDLLIQRLHENAASGPLNMTEWYNWTTFDIIGDLAFGSSFNCLDNSNYHPFVRFIYESPKETARTASLRYLGFWNLSLALFLPLANSARLVRSYSHATLDKRLKLGKTRPDLIQPLIEKKNEGVITMEQLYGSAGVFIFAGSETTASLLSGATFLLLKNPGSLKKLTEEVRSTFKSEEEINVVSVNQLTYMLACLNEALRYYPPAAIGFPRVTPPGGAVIANTYVPENTVVSVHHYASSHYNDNWTDSWSYRPERFLGDEEFANDKKDASKPFSLGPRDCVGKNLAYTEMRLILARLIWNFDLRLDESSENWLEGQQCYLLWRKPALKVHLTPVKRD